LKTVHMKDFGDEMNLGKQEERSQMQVQKKKSGGKRGD